ncbi:MAG TPA: HlyD family type I secretion periplasmic adaptor subunit [Candidatus Sulfotelmatobacter sp.]|nr:HlyD family type I secretion periplasmic adaptor subunit [Candidatus Sulfotelmatobacter sp.]
MADRTLETLSPLDRIAARSAWSGVRILSWIVMAFLGIAVVWSFFAKLDQVSVAQGEVQPQSKVTVIQHLEGGLIKQLYVKDGDAVKVGSPLVQLELAVSNINRDEIQVRLDALGLQRARLQSEAFGKPLVFPADEAKRRPDLVRSEQETFDARTREFNSAMSGLNDQVRQRELAVAEYQATKKAKEADLALSRERLDISTKLLKDQLTPRVEHLRQQSEVEKLDGELQTLEQSIPRAVAALGEARQKVTEERAKFQRRAQEELQQVEVNYARTVEILNEATDQRKRTLITSPTEGTVKNLRFTNLGGVVKPGEGIMEIVPTDDRLVIEARLNPTDRGYVEVGQSAQVKITTYDFVRYGTLNGKVTLISADSNADPKGEPYFRVVVETDKNYIGDDPTTLLITPGMQATVDIHTGTRSVAFYLMKPVLKLKNEAFHER